MGDGRCDLLLFGLGDPVLEGRFNEIELVFS